MLGKIFTRLAEVYNDDTNQITQQGAQANWQQTKNRASAIPPITGASKQSPYSYRPDMVIDGWTNGSLTCRAASQRGSYNRQAGTPRQDDFAIESLANKNWIIAAIADGAAAAKLSHIGAALAARAAICYILSCPPATPADINWAELFRHASTKLTARAQHELNNQNANVDAALNILATTLTCVVVVPTKKGAEATLAKTGSQSAAADAWLANQDSITPLSNNKAAEKAVVNPAQATPLPIVPDIIQPLTFHIPPGHALLIGTSGATAPLHAASMISGAGGKGSKRGKGGAGTSNTSGIGGTSSKGGIGGTSTSNTSNTSGTGGTSDDISELIRASLFSPALQDAQAMLGFAQAIASCDDSFQDDRTLIAIWPNTSNPKL
jgi:hypothetical protein